MMSNIQTNHLYSQGTFIQEDIEYFFYPHADSYALPNCTHSLIPDSEYFVIDVNFQNSDFFRGKYYLTAYPYDFLYIIIHGQWKLIVINERTFKDKNLSLGLNILPNQNVNIFDFKIDPTKENHMHLCPKTRYYQLTPAHET